MSFLERDLEDIIFETDNYLLNMRGLPINGKKLRQVRIGNYGIADLITIERPNVITNESGEKYFGTGKITIYELKKDVLDINSFLQVIGYVRGVMRYCSIRDKSAKYEISFALIGNKIQNNNPFPYLPNIIYDFNIYTFDYRFNGIYFKEHIDYKLTNEGF